MATRKFCVYIKDEEIHKLLEKTDNRSAYVEKAVRFYLDNKELLPRLMEALIKKS